MLSSVFKAVKETYPSAQLKLITDTYTSNTFYNDPYLDTITGLSKLTCKLFSKRLFKIFKKIPNTYIIWPDWNAQLFHYLATGNNLQDCIDAPNKNILSTNYARQISDEVLNHDDLRPRIYLTEEENTRAKKIIPSNAIGIHIAKVRHSQTRNDGSKYRYALEHWKTLCQEIKQKFPEIIIVEIGSEEFLGIGDTHVGFKSIRETAAVINQLKLMLLSDGGIHNICNAIDKKVLLFQAYEWNPGELFKMGNAIFNSNCHEPCSTTCHLFHEIRKIEDGRLSCNKECYQLNPLLLAKEAIIYLNSIH